MLKTAGNNIKIPTWLLPHKEVYEFRPTDVLFLDRPTPLSIAKSFLLTDSPTAQPSLDAV